MQHFEFIRSKKGCKLNIQKHEILLKICMRPWIRRYLFWRKLVITRRSWQLQSSYFACADLWTCWIRFWYSRSPKLTKMICFWRFSFLYFSYFSILQPPTHWADLQLGRTSNSEDLQLGTNGNRVIIFHFSHRSISILKPRFSCRVGAARKSWRFRPCY